MKGGIIIIVFSSKWLTFKTKNILMDQHGTAEECSFGKDWIPSLGMTPSMEPLYHRRLHRLI